MKTGEQDSSLSKDKISENSEKTFNYSVSDEELQYIITNYAHMDQTSVISQILSVYRRNQIVFLLLIISEILFSMSLLSNSWQKRERSINTMEDIFKDLNGNEASIIYYSFIIVVSLISVLTFSLALYSLSKKNITAFKITSKLYLLISLLTILDLYLNA